MHLSGAGISIGWLKVWLLSAGADHVSISGLEQVKASEAQDWCLYIGTEQELFKVALAHGKKVRVRENAKMDLMGARNIDLINPDRRVWYFRRGEKGPLIMLLSVGDLAYQREKWLSVFLGNRSPLPVGVWVGEGGGVALEPGLRGEVFYPASGLAEHRDLLNDGGYLPEEQLLFLLNRHAWRVRFAESCTGGAVSERLSRIPGASAVLDCAWVTYSNEAKTRMLGISEAMLEKHGAVSRQVAEAMAAAGRDNRHVCASVTGIAGPSGGSKVKPVGSVWVAVATPDGRLSSKLLHLSGSRAEIRSKSVISCLALAISCLKDF
jgi:PncC family amidohydrolase